MTLSYATYLGGHVTNTSDYLSGIAIDSAGYAYLVGYTDSNDFPVTSGAYITVCAPGGGTFCHAAHVTKLNPSGTAIVWSTYVGGSRQDGSDDLFFTGPIQLDGKGNVYIEGWAGPGFPLLYPVEPQGNGGSQELTIVELDPTGSKMLFAARIGSNGLNSTEPAGLAVDAAGNMYVAGNTNGPDLVATTGAFQTKSSDGPCCGLGNGFVAKIAQPPGPQITAGSVFNAATLQSGGIAPNEAISSIGLGPATGVASNLTTLLAGAAVYINGASAYLAWAQDGQVNVMVPFGVAGTQTATIQCEFNGVKGNTVTVPVVDTSPGIFTQAYGPRQAWVVNQDGTFNSNSNPAPRNSYVAFWITGQGNVTPPMADGVQPAGPPFPAPVPPVNVTLGGVPIPAANIAFAGLVYSGITQINVQIPANSPTGSAVLLAVTIGSGSSRTDVTIAIQ